MKYFRLFYRLRACRLVVVIFSMGLLLLSISFNGCGQKEAKVVEERVVNVQAQTVQTKILRPFVEAVGTMKSFEQVTISSEVDGILRSTSVEEGSQVSKGTLLAAIDDRDYINELKRVEAALRQAEATQSNTKAEHARKTALYKDELVTRQQYDDTVTRLAVSDADVDRAKATIEITRERLSKTRIYAPMAGFVSEKRVSVGDYVRNGTHIYTLVQINPIKLLFTVSEKDIGKLKMNQDVLLKVDAFPDREFKGKLSIIYPIVDEKTRTLQAEALVPNPERLLRPGLFARVNLYTGEERDMVVVPITAILYQDSKVRVFTIEGDRAREKPVKLGAKYDEWMEIVEGLRAGDALIVTGQQNLSEGVKVNVAR
jgi:membrane fusion protein, multidrug efflux system